MTYEDPNPPVGPLDFTDEEWRKYQSIPEQGYSHRHWLNYRNQKRLEERLKGVRELLDKYEKDEREHMRDFGQHHPYAGWAADHLRAALEVDS